MFAFFGTAETIILVAVGVFLAPWFFSPSHRGGPLLSRVTLEVNTDQWPAVVILAEHRGFGPWLLGLINRAPATAVEVGPTMLSYKFGAVLRPKPGQIPLAEIISVRVEPWHPTYYFPASFAVGFPLLLWYLLGRLTVTQAVVGCALVALTGALAYVQRTINLIVEAERRKKPLVFPFSALAQGQRPAVSEEELCEAADRIMELASEVRLRAQLLGRDPRNDGAEDRGNVLDGKVGNLPRLGPHIVAERGLVSGELRQLDVDGVHLRGERRELRDDGRKVD
jgi:hypothetical protein